MADIHDVSATPSIQLLLYQIAREALENAVRHSRACHIHIAVFGDSESVRLVVRDDGMGFHWEHQAMHFGLRIMEERVSLAGGLIHIDSEPGKGTQVSVRLPQTESDLDRPT